METKVDTDSALKPPAAAIIYGKIVYWLAIIGVVIALAGIAVYLASGGYLSKSSMLPDLWRGDPVRTLWKECANTAGVPSEYWYLGMLSKGDCLAMLGIGVACIAAVAGMWGVVFRLLRSKGGIYIVFALIIAAILTLSASGIINI